MIKFEVDTTLLQKAFSQLNEEVFETAIMTATQEIARELHKALLKNTPIKTGNLRKMWSAGDNLMFNVERVGNGFEVTLVNNAQDDKGFKYGRAVNYGHKTPSGGWVAGRFFVEASEAQTEPLCHDIVQKNLRKYFRRWLSGS